MKIKKIELSAGSLYIIFYLIFLVIASVLITFIEPQNFKSFFEGIWWSIVTASTVGYGDIYPHSYFGKIVAIFVIIGGMIAVASFTAIITTKLIEMKIFSKKDYEIMDNLKDHLIICGFKTPRKEVLASFKRLYKNNIVIVYPELTPELEDVLKNEGLKYAQGEYNDEIVLQEARVEYADKIMILNMHDEYADARVLETVIVIRSLNHKVYIIAEINDPKYENYLLKSKCNEIIMSEEYNRFLLSKSIVEPGMSKVVRNLLGTQNFHIVTKHNFTNKNYKEAFEESLKHRKILLGVIQNYITETEFKKIFLSKIRFGGELEKYKDLMNKFKRNEIKMDVLINPKDDFVIPEFSAIIIMERKDG